MASAGAAAGGSDAPWVRERGRAAEITRSGSRRGPSSSSASTTAKADGRRTSPRPLDTPGRATPAPAALIDLTSSGDELHSTAAAGRGQVAQPRGDGTIAGTSQQSLPHTPRPRRPLRVENPPNLTPNFRSAAAMAGWDDETLLMLAVGQESPAASSLRLTQARRVRSPDAGPSRAASCPDVCTGCLQCRKRKRGTRTSGQAATPLSAARRCRRARISSNGEPLKPIPMAVFNDEGDKCGAPARKSEGCSKKQHSDDKENKNPQPCSKSKTVNDGQTSTQSDALQLEQLREELTCVVCLDICFEPSTTSCGHSFCRGCLQSVYQKCGTRCPKCRQELRATSKSDCPINTVLWNTIQLLFPKETAARLKDQKKSTERRTEHAKAKSQQNAISQARRITRPTPGWQRPTTVAGLEPTIGSGAWLARNLTSFRRASEVLELGRTPTRQADGYQQMRGRRPASNSTTSSRPPHLIRQEQEDALLAARLQESFLVEAGL